MCEQHHSVQKKINITRRLREPEIAYRVEGSLKRAVKRAACCTKSKSDDMPITDHYKSTSVSSDAISLGYRHAPQWTSASPSGPSRLPKLRLPNLRMPAPASQPRIRRRPGPEAIPSKHEARGRKERWTVGCSVYAC